MVVLSVFLNDSSGCLIISQRSLRLARSPQNKIKKFMTMVMPKLTPLLLPAIFIACSGSLEQTKAWLVMRRGLAADQAVQVQRIKCTKPQQYYSV